MKNIFYFFQDHFLVKSWGYPPVVQVICQAAHKDICYMTTVRKKDSATKKQIKYGWQKQNIDKIEQVRL